MIIKKTKKKRLQKVHYCMHVQRLYCNVAGCLLLVERHPPTLSLAAIASINALFFAMVYMGD